MTEDKESDNIICHYSFNGLHHDYSLKGKSLVLQTHSHLVEVSMDWHPTNYHRDAYTLNHRESYDEEEGTEQEKTRDTKTFTDGLGNTWEIQLDNRFQEVLKCPPDCIGCVECWGDSMEWDREYNVIGNLYVRLVRSKAMEIRKARFVSLSVLNLEDRDQKELIDEKHKFAHKPYEKK